MLNFFFTGPRPKSEKFIQKRFKRPPKKQPITVQLNGIYPSTLTVLWKYVVTTMKKKSLMSYWDTEKDISQGNNTVIYISFQYFKVQAIIG